MKTSYKIIALLLLVMALGIIFYPTKVKPRITGYWTVNSMMVNGRPKAFIGTVTINENRIAINEEGTLDFLDNSTNKSTFTITGSDSLIITSVTKKPFDGYYKIGLQSTIIGGGQNAYYEYTLNLASKSTTLSMARNEPVHWNTGPLKGHP